jgi:phosphoserine aminotransferase
MPTASAGRASVALLDAIVATVYLAKERESMERRVFNFSPGPGMLPDEVLATIRDELLDWHGTGMSVLEMSHRGTAFCSILEDTEANLRTLLDIPSGYRVLFLQGGGHLQFAMVPLNLLSDRRSADYICTGYWSKRAIEDAQQYCEVNIVATSEATQFDRIPPVADWRLDPAAAYVHYVANDTASGVEFQSTPDAGEIPLVCDMSTNILTRPVDVERHALIYACAQKNIGIAGLTIVVIREDLLGRALPFTPRMLDYRVHAENSSMFNTPCTFAIYVAGLILAWISRSGGLDAMARHHADMSARMYEMLDRSRLYENRVRAEDRSRINIPFTLRRPELEPEFIAFAEANGLAHLRGNLTLGVRASLYNAMQIRGVERLIDVMSEFEERHG